MSASMSEKQIVAKFVGTYREEFKQQEKDVQYVLKDPKLCEQFTEEQQAAVKEQIKQAKQLLAGLDQSLLALLEDEDFTETAAEKFAEYDVDGSGFLDAGELVAVMMDSDPPPMMMDAETGEMTELTDDGSGMLEMIVDASLKMMDMDGDGQLSIEEFRVALGKLLHAGDELENSHIKRVWEHLCIAPSKDVPFMDFAKWYVKHFVQHNGKPDIQGLLGQTRQVWRSKIKICENWSMTSVKAIKQVARC